MMSDKIDLKKMTDEELNALNKRVIVELMLRSSKVYVNVD